MTVEQLRGWLRHWVATTTGLPEAEIEDTKPLETFGLSSRDAVVLSGELEDLLGQHLDATIAYEFPTIAALAERLVNGPADSVADTSGSISRRVLGGESHDIAVVGMAGRFPGANSVAEFWDMLAASQAGTGELPAGRWAEYNSDPVLSTKMREQNLQGGYFDDISSFDAEFFGLSPLEATNMDPQQRIMLETAWLALEDASIPANQLRGTATGVYVGSSNNDYGMLIAADPAEAHPYALTGASSAVIPNRISYALDLRGPSMNIDSACSSSLVAVHQAISGLRSGEADVALAGGVNIQASPFITTSFGELGVISPTGGIHAFSDDADGFVRADAAGFVVLKRLQDAEADGDRILAVIKGSAVNSDGHSNGLTAPNPDAQVDVLRRAYADAGVNPADVDYVEAHGTGTILGDPIEATALGKVVGAGRDNKNPVLLGSAKSNIGHSESAAGIVGLIKVISAMQHGVIPASINFSDPNRFIDFDAEHLEVVEDPREWPEYSGHKVAGVSGFGFGGTNAHVVLSEYTAQPTIKPAQVATDTRTIPLTEEEAAEGKAAQTVPATVALPISGLLPSRRRSAAAELAAYIADKSLDHAGLLALARSLAGRNHGRSRAVVLASTSEEAIKRLGQVAEGKVSVGISAADSPAATGPVFVYSGFGSQHRKMAKDLLAVSPLFAARLAELNETIDFESGWDLLELIEDDSQTYNTETAQVAITAIQIALTDLLASFGVRPAGVMGMSMGEIAAAYAAGGLMAKDAMLIACHRARLMGEGEASLTEETQGAMAVVEMTAADVAALEGDIEPAVYAGPGMTTVGGPRQQVLDLVEKLSAEGKFARALNVKGAGHTSAVEPFMGDLAAEIAGIKAYPLHTPLYSSVDRAQVHQPGAVVHTDEYFLRMTRQAVYFQDATEQALAAGHTQLVEIAPNPVALMGMMNTAFSVGKPDAQLLVSLKRKVDPSESLLELLAKLYVAGTNVDFTAVFGQDDNSARTVVAPHTEFKKQQYWTSARPSSGASGLPGARVTLPGGKVAFATNADQAPSALAIVEAAAAAVNPAAQVVANEEYAVLPAAGDITTVVERSLAGLSISVYTTDSATGAFEAEPQLIAEGFASTIALGMNTTDVAANEVDTAANFEASELEAIEVVRWDPATETVEERLATIVSESMGYDVSDLPRELPLIDLGLDSLMGMRIKNRVENDFQIPPLQVQALRDASLADVITMVTDAVNAKSNGAESGEVSAEMDTALADAEVTPAEQTNSANSTDAASSGEGGGVGVPPRDNSERMVFATWATFTGAAAAGMTSTLPEITAEQAEKIAQRLSERA
ncbi:MAG: beta-ketoacyl synthase N-terminal-like domain-containing protein, partial [Corynebacterium sp.]|nr:beta-ketoacyl synthase N-terminal-like domain-containing protein [Corynebacterium sp.]